MPFMYALVHVSTQIQQTELFVRLPSALFGIVGVYLIYKFADAILGRKSAYISAFLLALSPFLIWYTQDARYYAILCTLGLASVYSFFLAITTPKNKIWYWLAFVIVTAFLIYTHIFAFWILIAEGLFGLYALIGDYRKSLRQQGPTRQEVFKRSASLALSFGTLFVIALPIIIKVLIVLQSGAGPTGEKLAKISLIPKAPYFYNAEFFGKLAQYLSGGSTLVFFMIPLFILGLVFIWRKARTVAVLLSLILTIPFLTSFFLEYLHTISFKYFVYLIPYFLIVTAYGMVAISDEIGQMVQRSSAFSGRALNVEQACLLLLTLSLAIILIPPLHSVYHQNRVNDWRAIARYLEDQVEPGDMILTEAWGKAALNYYFQRGADVTILRASEDLLAHMESLGPKVWFIGLNGPFEKRIQSSHTPLDTSIWQDPRFVYFPPEGAVNDYPVTKNPANIYFLQDNPIPSFHDFEDISNAAWTDQTYREIHPGTSTQLKLAAEGSGPYVLSLGYLHQPNRKIDILVDGIKLDSIVPENTQGWQIWKTVIPVTAGQTLLVTLSATGSEVAAVNRIELERQSADSTITKQVEKPATKTFPTSVWIVGDSLTRGLFASSEADAYRNRLLDSMQAYYPQQIYSTFWQGVCTLGRLEMVWDSWLQDQPDVVFIELGINDLGSNRDCPQVPEEEWQARYGAMLDRILTDAPSARIVAGTVPWSNWSENSVMWDKALRYNKWIVTEANSRGLAVADLWSATVGQSDGISTPDQPSVYPPGHGDGFHPNDVGHRRLAQTLFEAYLRHYER
ncbi:MAG: hypothetical protein GY762_10915 [Proteobacteria bacterium]|nr:hypothetical protein [Pseudomonadota bacterium]